ncbi:8437_t:CDS:1, partial [Cetraspora pellucida]
PEIKTSQLLWYSKVEPLALHIRNVSKLIYLPKSQVSIDEMVIRFRGRSEHTVRIKNKPTPEGYKIISLCDSGYTYYFIFTSCIESNSEINSIPNINKIGWLVYHLISQLPKDKTFDIYMDNYFTSINLFSYMQQNGYDGCGTIRCNTLKFPIFLKIKKSQKIEWDTLSKAVVDDVLVVFWMDNGPVTMLTTIHKILGEGCRVERERRRPRTTSTNANKVRSVFGNASKKILPIPTIIDDYNYHMGGVDVTDQLRGYYGTQVPVRRTWMPLFFWLLDTSIVNTFLISKALNLIIVHKDLRINLVWSLIEESLDMSQKLHTRNKKAKIQSELHNQNSKKQPFYVTKKFELPIDRLLPQSHYPIYREERGSCVWCRFQYMSEYGKHDKNSPQSQ